MEITEVKVFPVNEEKLKAFVSVVFDRCFMVNDIKIIQGRDGLFISMPSRKKKSGEFKDVAHPLNNETRQMIEQVVVAEYERVLGERGEALPAPPRPFPAAEEGPGGPAEAPASAPPPALPAVAAAPPGNGIDGVEEAPGAAEKPPGQEEVGKSLEEIQEHHLRDSFWSVS
jgi:stage V sporulation protein G